MVNVGKKLSIAFYWHMHQPVYQLNPESDYLMPWVRLHSVKDYLDMLLVAKSFNGLRLNFNIVPALLDALIDYGEKGFHDIHSRLSVTDVFNLTPDDKEFILNNFFDANYATMIEPHQAYNGLYKKRFSGEAINIESFSSQEYSDIMMWHNLAWIDSIYKDLFPEFKKLIKKEKNYTLEDRIEIIELHRKIIRMIIPTYKELWRQNKIEITTSPYFHPMLPILLDAKSSQKRLSTEDSSLYDMDFKEDAKIQTKNALDRIEEVLGQRPKGMWPPELGISAPELELLKELGVQWTISDEGILASSLNQEFVRDFKGYPENPYSLTKSYKYKTKSSNIQIIFRDSVIPNLISFEYANHDPKVAAADFYDRIKVIQTRLKALPDKHHLLTIALDGENCWENYLNDGNEFLKNVYSLITKDETLETVLISEYLDKEKHHKELKKIYSGSWINKNFQFWIGEPVKNLAWAYLMQVKEDLNKFYKKFPSKNESLTFAHKELMIAQGSDWFWWYGEPNDSGQDHIFDYIFREHLKNVYKYLGFNPPAFLDSSIISLPAEAAMSPKKNISPVISGLDDIDEEEWENAGCIEMPDNPLQEEEQKLFSKICYGSDENNFYLRLYLNKMIKDDFSTNPIVNQLYIYMRNGDRKQNQSPIRLINKTDNISPIMKEKFHNELRISMLDNKLYPIRLTKSIPMGLWAIQDTKDIKSAFKKVIDLSISFDSLDIKQGENLEFFFAKSNFGIKETFIPQDFLLSIQRL